MEINEIDNKKTTEKINDFKGCFFQINKIEKPMSRQKSAHKYLQQLYSQLPKLESNEDVPQ